MEKILVSACLLGVNCKYNGKNNENENVKKLAEEYELIPICPEQLGGLPTPRVPSEIVEIDGISNNKERKVINKEGIDVTETFIKGAEETLKIAKLYNIKKAILKSKSPSCGNRKVYDGSFSRDFS